MVSSASLERTWKADGERPHRVDQLVDSREPEDHLLPGQPALVQHHHRPVRPFDGRQSARSLRTDVHLIHSPLDAGLTTVMMNVYVDDVDARYANAVAEGANITMELDDAFYGERRFEATDPEGHRWHFAERFEHIKARGGRPPEPEPEDPDC